MAGEVTSGQTHLVIMHQLCFLYVLTVYVAAGAAQNGPAGCVLPPYPPHGTYTVYDKPEAVPGQTYAFAILTVSCDPEYAVIGSNGTYCFGRNMWLQPLPQCTRFCRLTPDPSVNYFCKMSGDGIFSGTRQCNELEPDGTVVVPECNRPVYYSNRVLLNMRCVDGVWDHIAVCQPDCGTCTPVGEGLIINGTRVKRGELPWHAAIYDKNYTPFMQVCGGSLISTTVVISAAHCFWEDAIGRQPASRYAVALGKIYRPWNNTMDPGVHLSHVSEIKIPIRFMGGAGNFQDDIALVVMATPVVYVTYIRPVCIDFDVEFDRNQLQNTHAGKVSGWGLTSEDGLASQELLTTELSYVDVEKCIANLPDNFRPYVTSDKICAGGNATTVCRGDSGGGLAFPHLDRGNRWRYFLRGVVSTAPTNGHKCNTNSYTTFTHILPHATFIKDHGLDAVHVHDGPSTVSGCVLPAYPPHGAYIVHHRPDAAPGQTHDTAILSVTCDPGHEVVGSSITYCFGRNVWQEPMPQCSRFCKLTPDPSVKYLCRIVVNEANSTRMCNDYEPHGTVVVPTCNGPDYHADGLTDMRCVAGSWDHVAICQRANPMTVPTVSIQPSVNEYYEGDRIELDCVTTGNPTPTITWQRASGQRLPLGVEYNKSHLVITRARVEDSGEYRCVATNTAGSDARIAAITVRPRPSRPSRRTLTVSLSVPTVVEGQNTSITCTGTANLPVSSIGWIRQDGAQLASNVRSDNGVLYIDIARIENQGVYVCQTTSERAPSVSVLLTVTPRSTPPPSEAPGIKLSVDFLKILTGENGTIDCITRGYPPPYINWTKENDNFGPETSQRGNTLIISNAQVEDTGYYACMGSVDGTVIATHYAYVLVEIETRMPPKVEIWPPGEQAVPVGNEFELRCRVLDGKPPPKIIWSRSDGRRLKPYIHLQPHGVLKFDRVELTDEGEYICMANNLVGQASVNATIKVSSAPEITLTPGSFIEAKPGERVDVHCRAKGYPEPMVSIKLRTDYSEVVLASPGIASLHIDAASEHDDGDYVCTAVSAAGTVEEQFTVRVESVDGGFGSYDSQGSGEVQDHRAMDLIAIEGQETRLSCNFSNYVNPVRWSRVGQPLQGNAQQIRNELIIRSATKSDNGEYECVMVDRRTGYSIKSTYTALMVMALPRITLRPSTQTLLPGDSTRVICVVEGDNITDISWKPVEKPLSSRVQIRGPALIFRHIEVEDAGKYECSAENRLVKVSAVAEVIVNDKLQSCEPDQWLCGSQHQCVLKSWVCDGEYDCRDGSDEQRCPIDLL